MEVDYYKVLGLDRSSALDSIQRAYRRNALKLHPDKNKAPEAQDLFNKTAEAYDVLSDPQRKAIYDQFGLKGLQNGVPAGGDFEGFPEGYQFHGNAKEVFERFFGGKNPFQDFFAGRSNPSGAPQITGEQQPESNFGTKLGGLYGMAISSSHGTPTQNPPMIRNVEVSLEDMYNGAIRRVQLSRKVLNDDATTTSDGEKIFMLEIHKGWRHGTKVTFPKEGDQGCNKIPADVTFVIHEKPHPRFERKGNNLIYTAELPLLRALTGSVLDIETLDGRRLKIPVSEVVGPNYQKVVQNEGMPLSKNPAQHGDLLIKFNVQFPTYFNSEQKALLKLAFDENGTSHKAPSAVS